MVSHLSKSNENKKNYSLKGQDSFDNLENNFKIFGQEYNMLTSEVKEDIEEIDKIITKFENEYKLIPKEPEKPYSYLKFTGNLYDELTYSSTLAYFLDPQKPHGLNRFVLDAFLSAINTDKDLEFDTVDVDTEYPLPNGRRADIIIDGDSWLILIENKIWSSEGPDQTKDLYKGLQEDTTFAKIKNKYFIFLTPRGQQPSDKHFITLTYGKLFEELERHSMNLLSETPVATVIHLTDFLRTIKEEFMQENKKKEIFSKKSLLYLKYCDSIDDIRGTFYKDLESFGELWPELFIKNYNLNRNEWDYDVSQKYYWFAFYKKTWYKKSLYIHFEFWTNSNPDRLNVLPFGPVAFMVHVEGQKKDKFFNLFDKNKQQIMKEYKRRQMQYNVRHGSYAKVIAYKEYPIGEDLNKISDIIVQAFGEFQFLIKYIDDTLKQMGNK